MRITVSRGDGPKCFFQLKLARPSYTAFIIGERSILLISRDGILALYENRAASALLEYIYDDRMVRPPEIPPSSAAHRDRGELADCLPGILFSGANRIGYGQFTGFQLKIIQEVITLCVFTVFAWVYLGEEITWRYGGAFFCILGAVAFAFWGRL
jgi:Putative member of DMT superfamily (DUF486)